MAHPSTRCTVTTNVAEATIVIPIRRTEADFFDCLIDEALFGVLIDYAQTIAADVQLASDGSSTGALQDERENCSFNWMSIW